MSYAIANFVFGVPLTSNIAEKAEELDFDPSDPESFGFEGLYSAGGDGPLGFLGVQLTQTDECSAYEKGAGLKLQPTPEQEQKYWSLWAEVPEGIRAILPEPETWLIWSSS